MNDQIARAAAGTAVKKRFLHQPFLLGTNDCVRLAACVLRHRGRPAGLAKAGSYKTVLGAKRALTKLGYETLAEAVDALGLVRIPPRAALAADLVMIPGEGPFGGALTMAAGNGRVLGWHQDLDGADFLQPVEYVAAWRT